MGSGGGCWKVCSPNYFQKYCDLRGLARMLESMCLLLYSGNMMVFGDWVTAARPASQLTSTNLVTHQASNNCCRNTQSRGPWSHSALDTTITSTMCGFIVIKMLDQGMVQNVWSHCNNV